MKFFLDTYALVEIAKGNKNFDKYLDADSVTFKLNLAEFYYSLLTDAGEKTAEDAIRKSARLICSIPFEIISKAMKIRKENRKKNLSYADCLGYAFALENNRLFLTGDKEFKDMKEVEFVR